MKNKTRTLGSIMSDERACDNPSLITSEFVTHFESVFLKDNINCDLTVNDAY